MKNNIQITLLKVDYGKDKPGKDKNDDKEDK